jgi:hypothetical protein
MNHNFMLQNLIENGSSAPISEQRYKKNSKICVQDIEMQVGTVYN